MIFDKFDIIVVGGGHAGCEAATAAANLGNKTLLITMNMNAIAAMSCNPAVGGIAKGQIVREIDAMGGQMGIIADKTMIQFRMLNKSKGPAVWSPRVQSDKFEFSTEWRNVLEKTNKLEFWQDHVDSLIVEGNIIKGVHCTLGGDVYAKAVILTNGTFLNGKIFIGEKSFTGGRISESASYGITEQLVSLGFEADRMKTGTPMRIDGRSIDFSKLSEQKGDENVTGFSYMEVEKPKTQRSCHIAYTSLEVHNILRKGFEKSPLFTGRIKGIGPRYCPSIEDKIERFADKDFHQLFVEPEGRTTIEYYLNGFSSSLPEDIQVEALHHIEGFENAKIFRPGYAIEYDFFPPNQLYHSLETHQIHGLFFAGQINGTTGYEEAAAQGLMAGINAHRLIHDLEPIVLRRDEAYIGVLIDDLITKSVDEPYRMFTSRAEYRILLRQDNADARLTEKAFEIGLASEERINHYRNKYEKINNLVSFLKNNNISPDKVNALLESKGTPGISNKMRISQIITRPQINLIDIINLLPELKEKYNSTKESDRNIIEEAEIVVKYEGYIDKEREVADKLNRLEDVKLSPNFDYYALNSLTMEAREKLTKHKPQTLGQASRISGISPADISVIAVFLGR
ncbi:MAG: tRNA uridine-5-carboxymethylaminomethyl(34) synthesis enzyme MnmG [Bacteroidales bacterium]|nr:tRNA uridine-5-carboxymethylaminomethyl(34) synthesis enzyme MnmG [Bacteroidales bacterium]